MAISKIAKIRGKKNGMAQAKAKLNYQIQYILNGEKTEDGILVSAFSCTPQTAVGEFLNTSNMINQRSNAILAYHLKQSFAPGEVSPDEAHKIGKEFADKILQNKYQYVIATHIDKEHIHNHIIFCATSNVAKEKYHDCDKERYRREQINDLICSEHGLSVVAKKSGKKGWRVWENSDYQKAGKRKTVQEMAEVCMKNASNIQEFMLLMEQAGCMVTEKNGSLSFLLKGSSRQMHERSFYVYDEGTGDKIRDFRCSFRGLNEHFNENKEKKNLELSEDRRILIFQIRDEIEEKKRADSSQNDMEKMVKTLNYLEENSIDTDTKLIDLENLFEAKYEKAKAEFSEKNEELKTLSMKINYAKNYWKYKKIYEKSRKENADFSEENSESILKFLKAKAFFDSVNMPEKALSVKGMTAAYGKMKKGLEELKKAFEESKNEYKRIIAVRMNCEMIVGRKISKSYDNESAKNHHPKEQNNSNKDLN